MRTLIQVQAIPPRTPPQPVEWFGPMPPIGSEMTIVGVKHEVVKYSYDVEYAMPTLMPTCDYGNCESHTGKPCARGHESPYDCPLRANPSPLGSMRCTQLTIHLKPKHREPEGDLIAGLIKGQAVKDGSVSEYERRNDESPICNHRNLQAKHNHCPDCGLPWIKCSDTLAV